MNHQLKKHIRILSERFGYVIDYYGSKLKLSNELNDIFVDSPDKYGLVIEFNGLDEVKRVKLKESEVCGFLIELMRRVDLYSKARTPLPIDPDLFKQSEGYELSVLLKRIKEKVENEKVESFQYGGNMFEIEYYKGLVILMGITEGFGTGVIELN
ncbi:MAG: hypothetical protein NXI09_09720 [Bacteroidetes bacterium]|nr:hypothetical protein [Bacteroidota bacterium]